MKLNEMLKNRREELGLTVRNVADKCGVNTGRASLLPVHTVPPILPPGHFGDVFRHFLAAEVFAVW